jgi:hypothetical protein
MTTGPPIAYVGVNGDVGTVHLRLHEVAPDELIRLLEQVRPLLRRPEIAQIRLTGHVRCSPTGAMTSFVGTVETEVAEAGKSLRISGAACPDAVPAADGTLDRPA